MLYCTDSKSPLRYVIVIVGYTNVNELNEVLTKSSPESAPSEVMDSLLMVRGIRTPLRGAVAASSAIFFFNLANISVLSVSL